VLVVFALELFTVASVTLELVRLLSVNTELSVADFVVEVVPLVPVAVCLLLALISESTFVPDLLELVAETAAAEVDLRPLSPR